MRVAVLMFAFLTSCLLAACSSSSDDPENLLIKSINPERLSPKDAIKLSSGSVGTQNRTLYVFVKPGCIFCNRLETVFRQFSDLTVHQFIVASRPSHDFQSEKLFCMRRNLQPDCDSTAVYRNRDLAMKLGIHAAPTMIFADGKVRTGLLFRDELEEMLNRHSSNKN